LSAKDRILAYLRARPGMHSNRELSSRLGLPMNTVRNYLLQLWRSGLVNRSADHRVVHREVFRGRLGIRRVKVQEFTYCTPESGGVPYGTGKMRRKGVAAGLSARQAVEHFLSEAMNRFIKEGEAGEAGEAGAYYSKEITSKLGLPKCSCARSLRTLERQGRVFVKGIPHAGGRETPFKQGFLAAWVPKNVSRDEALKTVHKAFEQRLREGPGVGVLAKRVYDVLYMRSLENEPTFGQELVAKFSEFQPWQVMYALRRSAQLWSVRRVQAKTGHESAYVVREAVKDMEEVARKAEERARWVGVESEREGHNREAAFEFFILKADPTLELVRQRHRNRVDPARFFSFDLKNGRAIEFDRVFVKRAPLMPDVYYVFEFGGIITKAKIDGFQAKLAVSKEFGSNVSGEWRKKANVLGLMGGSTFNPKEVVEADQTRLTLGQYAFRQGIRLISLSDLNSQMAKRGFPKQATVQAVVKACVDENHVRQILAELWKEPAEAEETLKKARSRLEQALREQAETAKKWRKIG